MADVPRSISLSKNLSNVGRSKHIYDGVFSAPTATKRNTSTFSIRIDDYLDIFSPSDASLGSSIPIFDLPAVDRSDIIGRGRSSGVDYAGVFGGLGDDDQVGVPTEMLFRDLKKKKKAKADTHPSRSSKPTKIMGSRSQEFFLDSGNKPASKSPAKTTLQHVICGSTKDNPTPSQISESTRKAGTSVSKGLEFSGSSKDRDNTLSSQASKSPTQTRENEMSSNVSTDQLSDGIKHLNVPLQKINQSSNDPTQIAHLHAVPEHTGKISSNKANQDTDLSMDVSKGKRKGKQTRSISDLGKDKQLSVHDAHRAFGMRKSNTFNATQSTREANSRPESVSPQLFGSNDYFRRSSSQRSKSCTESQKNDGSTSPLLELDVNSTAAASVAAVERAIEEAEAKIRRAKEFLKGHECDGSTHLSFKRSLKVKAVSNTCLNQNGVLEVEEEKILEQKGHLDATVRSENVSSNKAGGLKLKDDLDFTTSDSQLSSEAGLMLNEKLHGVSAQEDTTTKHASLDPEVCVNDAKFVGKNNSSEVVTSTEKSYKDEGAGEWEAAKHISQLISGVKNRFVSFISKQVDTEKIAVQDIPSSSGSMEQFGGSTDADIHLERANDEDDVEKDILQRFIIKQTDTKDQVEKDDEMINDPSSGVEEIVHVSNIYMNITKPEEHITVALEEENVVDDIVFQEVDVLLGHQCDLSVEIAGKLIQEEIQNQSEEILDDCQTMEHEKDKVEIDGCEEDDMEQITACQSGVHVLEKEIICKDNDETQEDVQDQELVEEGCSLRETEMPKEDFQMVEKTYTDEFQETEQVAELLTGVTKVEDDTIEHGEQKLEDCRDELQETVHATEFFTESIVGVNKVTDDTSEHDEQKLDDAQIVEETCPDKLEGVHVAELFTWEDNETAEYQDVKGNSSVGITEVTIDTSEHDEQKLDDAQIVEEDCTDKLEVGVQVAELFTLEANETVEFQDLKGNSTVGVTEVIGDEKKLEDAQMVEETCTDKLHVEEVFTWEDNEKIDTPEHDEKKLEDDQTEEEDCTDKLEGVQVAELFTLEANKTVGCQDVQGKSTVGVTEVIDDEKKLEDAQTVEETCTDKLHEGVQVAEVFTWEDNEKIDTFEHDEKKLENDQTAEETCTDKLQGGVQVAESFTWEGNERIDTSEHDKKKLEDAQMVEETCADKLQGGVQVAVFELFKREDNEAIERINVESKITIAEVVEDTYDHDEKKLQDDQIVEETCTDELHERIQAVELLTREDNEFIEHQDVKSALGITEGECLHEESAQHVISCSGGEEKIEELATSTIDLKMNTENALDLNKNVEPFLHDISSHLGSSSGGEESMEEPITCHVEPEMNVEQPICSQITTQSVREDMCEQKSYPSAVDDDVTKSHTCDQEQSSMMRNVDAGLCDGKDQYPQDVDSTEGNIHQPSTKCTIHDLIKKEMYEQTGCYIDVANETLAHEDECSPPADETLDHEDVCSVSADACKNEVHSYLTGDNEGYKHDDRDEHSHIEFSCEDEKMAESVVATTSEPELSTEQPMTVEKTQCETDVDFEQEYTCEEVFPVDINTSENQGDETDFKTDVGEVDSAETSCKRKQWFVNRVKADEFHQSGILLDQENTQGPTVDDGEKTKGNKWVKESGEDTNASQTDACSSAGDVCHITEAYHRRRRWLVNRDQEVLSKPIVLDGTGMTTQMDDQIGQDSELVNEGENSRATAKSDHRRRRWFESSEKLEPIQKPGILEDIGVAPNQEENTAIRDETDEKNHRNQLKRAEKEKRRERKAVQRAIREARERAFVDAQERAAIEARQKAAAQDKQEKVSPEPKSGSETKPAMEAKLREERAAVERATSEARERAMQKAIFEKAASMSKEKGLKNRTSTSCNPGYSSATFSTAKPSGVVSESPRRRKAISERHKRTMERAAKALEEKNMRDFLAQKEEAERNRLADALDVDVKRWLTGKEGNLQAMLSTLQYILGPDSGWQPIPLTDLMTSTAVRKAYKRAALCVHPDKLQQRGATIQQKYICEMVFDLLKDAWHKFNPDDW